ncbi:hypothetical protein TNCV_2974251 [Trichonephila clavipes]|nr:hypothetical protein TNCV_2974251 [Trichonephila clavipes]
MTPDLVSPSPNFHTTPTGERLSLDIFKVHQPLLHRGIFSGTGLELMTHQTRDRHLDHWLPQPPKNYEVRRQQS